MLYRHKSSALKYQGIIRINYIKMLIKKTTFLTKLKLGQGVTRLIKNSRHRCLNKQAIRLNYVTWTTKIITSFKYQKYFPSKRNEAAFYFLCIFYPAKVNVSALKKLTIFIFTFLSWRHIVNHLTGKFPH